MSKEHAAFFYGTLMHPKILKAVIKNEGAHLKVCPAVLLDYTRHEVKGCDYPGIIPFDKGVRIINKPLTREERSVRGTLVTGLTDEDIVYLDRFESDVGIHEKDSASASTWSILGIIHRCRCTRAGTPPPLPSFAESLDAIEAETYVYGDERDLEANLWSFEDFVKNNAWKWYGEVTK
ncbi:hypothetical protein CPB84DRAFT_1960658 [Gymnopilus junonius]|uniref:Putative gamma-glutamylcyclotransferase n=1 Tax=Gymnopilus junonius TaxID=109634 RepID=A0A9P5TQC3_GYMJU|nr:hypothetical protein CPB84DRAFT_1960658 [Gymnopilus junonius]